MRRNTQKTDDRLTGFANMVYAVVLAGTVYLFLKITDQDFLPGFKRASVNY